MRSLKDLVKRLVKPKPVREEQTMRWLVVGLGNPDRRYEHTRHNVGYMALDQIVDAWEPVTGVPAVIHIDGDVVFVRSRTYMNDSGLAVAPLAERFHVPADHILVVHDELDLPSGTVRLKVGGSENGHRGLLSVTRELGTVAYPRVRVGIGRPAPGETVIQHVLGPVEETFDAADVADAVRLVIEKGVVVAQNEVNRGQ